MDAISFCEQLKPEDWDKQATPKWKVKDIVSHLVGWDREVVREFRRTWESGDQPWFMMTDDYDAFNVRIYEEFKDYSPAQLIQEFEKWAGILDREIEKIGENEIRKRPNMDWLFDEGDEPHFDHHLNQIQKALAG
jgi:hypothetical protein